MLLKGDMTFQGKILPKVKMWWKKKKGIDAKSVLMRLLLRVRGLEDQGIKYIENSLFKMVKYERILN